MNVEQPDRAPVVDDRLIGAMLARRAAGGVPLDLRDAILGEVEGTGQAWALPRRITAPSARLAWIVAIAALLAALVGGSLLAGAGPSRGDDPLRPAVVLPTELDRPGLTATDGSPVQGTWTYLATVDTANPDHAAISTFRVDVDHPEVTGDGRYDFGLRMVGGVGPTTGVITITNDAGSWAGTCTGANWAVGDGYSVTLACWLGGTGGYEGWTLYLQLLGGTDVPMRADGIVFPGRPPVPEEE